MALRRFLPLVLLAAASLALWCAFTARWTVEAWRTPLQLGGDPLEIYARVQAAAEDLSQPLRGYAGIARLGAPFGADWSRYPVSDRIVFTALGALARVVGVFAAVNLAMAFVHVVNAVAFFLCARFLRWRVEWAIALALLFSFSSYNFRWGVTISLSLSFVVPGVLLLCGWIARGAPVVRARGWLWLAAVLGAWLGGGNPYLGFFSAQLVALSLALQLLRRRETLRIRGAVLFLGALGVSFLLHHAAYFLAEVPQGPRVTLARNYAASELYALKLTDLVVPPTEHPLAAFGAVGRAYYERSTLRTEFFMNYLGVVGLAGLIALLWAGLRGAIRRGHVRLPDAFLGAAWLAAFSAVGGVNSLLALAGFDLFRASNRSSIFLLAWALFFLGAWCQRRRWLLHPALRFTVPAAVVAIGVLDCVPQLPAPTHLRANAAVLRATRDLMSRLEQQLGSDAQFFQLPATVFPEAGPAAQMGDYEHFLPYLGSNSLRFSYGSLRGTTAAQANGALAQLPLSDLKAKLESLGFDAIWLDRRGFPDGGNSVVERLRVLALPEFAQTALPHVAIFLLPSSAAVPKPDLYDPDLFPAWDAGSAADGIRIAAVDGWYPLEREGARSWRWAERAGRMSFALPAPGTMRLGFQAWSRDDGEIVLEVDGREHWREPISRKKTTPRAIELTLGAGNHHLRWHYTGDTKRGSSKDPRELGFALENVTAIFTPAEP